MKISTRKNGNITIVDLVGRLTLGEGVQVFCNYFEMFVYGRLLTLEEKHKTGFPTNGKATLVLLNLGGVSYIDSSGLGELVYAFTKVTNNGGQLKLLSLNKRIQDLLQLTKLNTVFDCFDDEAAAVRSFEV